MAIESRIRELNARHRSLDEQIESELRRPAKDELKISKLKRQKLRLKENIEQLKAETRPN